MNIFKFLGLVIAGKWTLTELIKLNNGVIENKKQFVMDEIFLPVLNIKCKKIIEKSRTQLDEVNKKQEEFDKKHPHWDDYDPATWIELTPTEEKSMTVKERKEINDFRIEWMKDNPRPINE